MNCKSLAKKNMLILIFSFLPFMAGLSYSVYISSEKAHYSAAINIAGSQRMRTMLLAFFSQRLHASSQSSGKKEDAAKIREIFSEEIARYKQYYFALLHGDTALGLNSGVSSDVNSKLEAMREVMMNYVSDCSLVLMNPHANERLQRVTSGAIAIKAQFHEVTEMYQHENDNLIQRQRIMDIAMLLLAGVVTLSGLFFNKKIGAQEAKLLEAKMAAEKASKVKSEFLANMSHEIRTPLNGVIGFTELLLKTPLSAQQHQYVEIVNTSGQSLLSVINDILDFSKIEAGLMELECIKTDLIDLIEISIDIIKFSAAKKNLEVLMNVPFDLPRFAVVDPVRLRQILVNLLGNAVKFTNRGEVEFAVNYTDLGDGKGKMKFSVRDTGIGIDEDTQKKLFKAFRQGDCSTTRKYGGSGLGLTISDMLARKMGSRINISSKPGVGSTFSFELTTEVSLGDKFDISAVKPVKNCLVIDDNYNNRLILENMISGWGISCVSCGNGKSVPAIIEASEPFDVIVCDYHMPEFDGIETIKLIRENTRHLADKQPVIILYSSADNNQLHKQCDELGVSLRLTKPVSHAEMFRALVAACNPGLQHSVIRADDAILVDSCSKGDFYTILIAEDVQMNMLLTTTMICSQLSNVRILEAKNGVEALRLWKLEKPGLIFMDVNMPEMDGIEATREIRKLEKESDTRTMIIALTAGAMKEEQERCLEAGMDSCLLKPIEPAKLAGILHYLKKDRVAEAVPA